MEPAGARLSRTHQPVLEKVRAPQSRNRTSRIQPVDPACPAVRLPSDLWRKPDHAENGGTRTWSSRAVSELEEQYHRSGGVMACALVQMPSLGPASTPG